MCTNMGTVFQSSKTDVDILSNLLEKIESVTKKPDKYLCLQEKKSEEIKLLTRDLYNFCKQKEDKILQTPETLKELVIRDLDEEQIWQQIELQNNAISDKLVHNVSHLLAKKNQLNFPLKKNSSQKKLTEKNKKKTQKNVEFQEGSNDDEDEEKEEEEDYFGDSDEERFETENKKKKKEKKKSEPGKPSVVDDEFFKLYEMEEFLEKMEKNEKSDEEDDDISYFIDDEELETKPKKPLHYKDFFDEPEGEESVTKKKRKNSTSDEKKSKKVKFSLESKEEEDEDEDEEEEENENEDDEDELDNLSGLDEEFEEGDETNEQSNEDSQDDDEEDEKETKPHQPSSFEARQERLKSKIKALEEEALQEKPWQLKGEVTATKRPQNSLLEEYVEFDVATRPKPVLTEKSTLKLEDIIKQRIKDKAWDDVVRKIKPVEKDLEYRKKLVLDQEKSKVSLAEIYEKEYLQQLDSKTQDLSDKPEVEPPEHQEIRIRMNKLFTKLDALSNYHFTPKPAEPEIKIVSNLPAITMEEVAPVAISDAALLAPEEVKAKTKGDLMGKSERTATDKKRERRQKKLKQKLKAKKNEKEGKEDDPKDKNLPLKLLQKITKSKNVTQLKENKDKKYIKSSNAFFSKLQEETSTKIKRKSLELKTQKLGKKLKSKKSIKK